MAERVFVSCGANDRFYVHVARNAGYVPDLFAQTARFQSEHRQRDYRDAQYRGAIRRRVFWNVFAKIGRKRAILLAVGLALPLVPLWAYAQTPVMLATGAFLIQFMVQGAWGVIPAHLSELAPNALRGTFIGFTYQLGNLFSSGNAPLQSHLAEKWHGDYAGAMARVIVIVLICVFVITALGREAKDVSFANEKEKRRAEYPV